MVYILDRFLVLMLVCLDRYQCVSSFILKFCFIYFRDGRQLFEFLSKEFGVSFTINQNYGKVRKLVLEILCESLSI